jgi:hypothetical protein
MINYVVYTILKSQDLGELAIQEVALNGVRHREA